MALDPRIPQSGGGVPPVLQAVAGGLNLAESIRQQPLRQALMQQQVQSGQFNLDAARQQQQAQQAAGQRDIAAQRGAVVNRFAQSLKQLPENQRAAALQNNRQIFDALGVNIDRFTDLGDQSLDRVILGTRAFAPDEKAVALGEGQRLVGAETGRVIAEGAEKPRDVSSIVKDFRGRHDKLTQDFKDVDAAFRKVNSASDNAQGDMSLIFGFMKLLDPGSTVREGEFASAEQATGVPGRIVNLYNRALEGTRLGDDQRSGFIGEAKKLFDAQQASADEGLDIILDQMDEEGLSRQRVIGKKALQEFNQRKREKQKERSSDVTQLSDSELLNF